MPHLPLHPKRQCKRLSAKGSPDPTFARDAPQEPRGPGAPILPAPGMQLLQVLLGRQPDVLHISRVLTTSEKQPRRKSLQLLGSGLSQEGSTRLFGAGEFVEAREEEASEACRADYGI